jgi:hypothetical protein
MVDRIVFRTFDALGYLLCELAFRTDCRGPFALAYRAGCRCYGVARDRGIRCGELVPNPAYRAGGDEPMYVRRPA